ncbi:MAG: HsdM family class I SAM-dependent methyltransferase [Chitinophagales bacterium]
MIAEKRIYQAYYTKSAPIVNYMVELLNLNGDEKIFEPAAGDGVFIDHIIAKFSNVMIDAFELNSKTYQSLAKKYLEHQNIKLKQTDTLIDTDLALLCAMGGKYDVVIANPPYGAWRDVGERKKLKKIYHGFYVKESYSLFLYRCITALKENGRLVFIIPDTYLNLRNHKGIRKYILSHTKIKKITLFPASYFPNVNFGYANLSIISLEKCTNKTKCFNNNFDIIQGFQSVQELNAEGIKHIKSIALNQEAIYANNNHAFTINTNPKISSLIYKPPITIGDLCHCVTGFYSGNDKEFLKVRNKKIRNSRRYNTIELNKVEFNNNVTMVNGLNSEKTYVPIVKGGNVKYYKADNWFMNWSKDSVQFFKKNQKARYQNASFYFKKGLAIPMVSSKSITASLIENRLFDQSIVGVFPKDEKLTYFLLSFFNSPTCNQLIRTINSSANNSSNYIKKIPIIIPKNEVINKINRNIEKILFQIKEKRSYNFELENRNNKIIEKLYGF